MQVILYNILNPSTTTSTTFFKMVTYSQTTIIDSTFFFGTLAFSEKPGLFDDDEDYPNDVTTGKDGNNHAGIMGKYNFYFRSSRIYRDYETFRLRLIFPVDIYDPFQPLCTSTDIIILEPCFYDKYSKGIVIFAQVAEKNREQEEIYGMEVQVKGIYHPKFAQKVDGFRIQILQNVTNTILQEVIVNDLAVFTGKLQNKDLEIKDG